MQISYYFIPLKMRSCLVISVNSYYSPEADARKLESKGDSTGQVLCMITEVFIVSK